MERPARPWSASRVRKAFPPTPGQWRSGWGSERSEIQPIAQGHAGVVRRARDMTRVLAPIGVGVHPPAAKRKAIARLDVDLAPGRRQRHLARLGRDAAGQIVIGDRHGEPQRSEEHTSELQSLMRISYAVSCLKKKKTQHN